MPPQKEKLRPEDENLPPKRRFNFHYLATVALVLIVLFVAVKYYNQGIGMPVDPYLELGPR